MKESYRRTHLTSSIRGMDSYLADVFPLLLVYIHTALESSNSHMLISWSFRNYFRYWPQNVMEMGLDDSGMYQTFGTPPSK